MADKHALVDTSDLARGLSAMAKKAPGAASQIVRKAAFDVQARAVELAPVDTGSLRASGQTVYHGGRQGPNAAPAGGEQAPAFPVEPAPEEAFVAFTMEYAAAVHEDTDAAHPRGGQAKYLERAIDETAGRMMDECRGILGDVKP